MPRTGMPLAHDSGKHAIGEFSQWHAQHTSQSDDHQTKALLHDIQRTDEYAESLENLQNDSQRKLVETIEDQRVP
ncbi:hypothetical protein, partial [uncultured Bifidobacterium sp.]|uniref:hypothetical protein n=1 Tax=uncultured Bifidobacterium sp. TaxID=165187 RepID=UPI002626E3C6